MKCEPPEEAGAPAYMAQFTALMTILLAFFICMLTMGQNKISQYKQAGVGYIRNAFGAKGGVGVLPFWKSMMKGYPPVDDDDDDDDKDLQGYKKGAFETERFDAHGLVKAEIQDRGRSVRITSPVAFQDNETILDEDARASLDSVGRVFFSLPQHIVTVCCFSSEGSIEHNYRIATLRASSIARYLEDSCGLPRTRLRIVGYADERYLVSSDETENLTADWTERRQAAFFLLRKKVATQSL